MLRQVSAMPTNRFHGLGLWPSIPVLLARVPHQTADCFYRPGTALRGMTAGKGGEELYKQKQALNVSYERGRLPQNEASASRRIFLTRSIATGGIVNLFGLISSPGNSRHFSAWHPTNSALTLLALGP